MTCRCSSGVSHASCFHGSYSDFPQTPVHQLLLIASLLLRCAPAVVLTTAFSFPVLIMFTRFLRRGLHEGLMAMFTYDSRMKVDALALSSRQLRRCRPPLERVASKRSLPSQLRSYLYARTNFGYWIDVIQARMW
jgi:hypothetical protein